MIERIVANGHGALRNPEFLAIHSTANPGASAANHVNYWKNNPTYAVHAVSDWKEAYHTVPWDRLCYQVGNGNSKCIGIEICEATNEADFMKGMEIARDAIWEMLDMKGWGVDRLRSHDWFRINYGGTDHTDPIPYLKKYGKDWNWFVDFVSQRKAQNVSRPVQMYAPNGSDAQKFVIEWDEAREYVKLVNLRFGLALDVQSAGKENGTPVWLYTPNGSDAQWWKPVPAAGNWLPAQAAPIEFEPKCAPGKRLDIAGGTPANMENGARLNIYDANGTEAQRFSIIDKGDRIWEILSDKGGHLALDAPW